jgi:hypothetical protein
VKIIIGFIVVMVLLGVLGHETSKGYHCHYIRVGDSIVCQ